MAKQELQSPHDDGYWIVETKNAKGETAYSGVSSYPDRGRTAAHVRQNLPEGATLVDIRPGTRDDLAELNKGKGAVIPAATDTRGGIVADE